MAIDQIPPSSLLDIQQLLSLLTTEEKVLLLSGADEWQTQGIERLGIGSLKVESSSNHVSRNKVADQRLDYRWAGGCKRAANGRWTAGGVSPCTGNASCNLVKVGHQIHREAALQRSEVKIRSDRSSAYYVLREKSARGP